MTTQETELSRARLQELERAAPAAGGCLTVPYVVTPNTEGTETLTRRAVATSEEARWEIRNFTDSHFAYYGRYHGDAVSEQGGTVGPLPDGTVIELEHVTWPRLGELASRPYRFGEYDQTIGAFNAAVVV